VLILGFHGEFLPFFHATERDILERNDLERHLQNTNSSGEFIVEWDIDLGGKDFLLESDFLKAGLERSVKEFINNDIMCNEDLMDELEDSEGTSFFSVEINNDNGSNKLKRISGTGRCKGNRTRCKKKVKKSISDAGKANHTWNTTSLTQISKKLDVCERFFGTSIFDLFRETLVTASFFNYNVDVELINDLSGSLDLQYNVEFTEASGNGLNEIQDIDFDAGEPIEKEATTCNSQCLNQRKTMNDIFMYYDIPFEEGMHECLHKDINCNEDDLVTQVWLGKFFRPL